MHGLIYIAKINIFFYLKIRLMRLSAVRLPFQSQIINSDVSLIAQYCSNMQPILDNYVMSDNYHKTSLASLIYLWANLRVQICLDYRFRRLFGRSWQRARDREGPVIRVNAAFAKG